MCRVRCRCTCFITTSPRSRTGSTRPASVREPGGPPSTGPWATGDRPAPAASPVLCARLCVHVRAFVCVLPSPSLSSLAYSLRLSDPWLILSVSLIPGLSFPSLWFLAYPFHLSDPWLILSVSLIPGLLSPSFWSLAYPLRLSDPWLILSISLIPGLSSPSLWSLAYSLRLSDPCLAADEVCGDEVTIKVCDDEVCGMVTKCVV